MKTLLFLLLMSTGISMAHALPAHVIVQQSGVEVTVEDVDQFAQTIPEKDRAAFFDSPKRIEQVLQNLLTQKLVVQDVRRQEADPILLSQIDKDPAGTYRRQLERVRDSDVPDMTVLAEEMYAANRSDYVVAGRIDVQYLKASVEAEKERGKPKPESLAAAKATMNRLRAQIQSDVRQFDAIYGTPEQHGVEAGTLEDAAGSEHYPDATRAAARSLKAPSDVSAVVEEVGGIYILKAVVREPDRQLTFDEVKDSILEAKRTEYVKQRIDEYLGSLRTTPMEFNPEAIASLRTRYANGAQALGQ